jgi:hypothetical protein
METWVNIAEDPRGGSHIVSWVSIVFVIAAAVIVGRIFFNVRKVAQARKENWDEKLIQQLRAKGYAPFNDYPVDFFLALPDDAACGAVRAKLEGEGFAVDIGPVEHDPELHFSLHATKNMRLITATIQETSAHLTAIATENRGRYDGWTA